MSAKAASSLLQSQGQVGGINSSFSAAEASAFFNKGDIAKLRTTRERPLGERSVVRQSQGARPDSHKEQRGGQPCPASDVSAVRPLGSRLFDGAQQWRARLSVE